MKSVVVTGGTVRIGKAIAERLRADGWCVITASHRADSGSDIVVDLSEPTGAARLYSAAMERLGGIPPDALVNNAALFVGDPDAMRILNFETPKKLTMLMAGREDGVGSVVNMLDTAALGGDWSQSNASDGYLELKRELLNYTIRSAVTFAATLRVNGVAPGPVLAPTDVHESAGEMLLDHRPTVADVAAAVSFLLSAPSTTGCIIPVDAGQHLLEK